MSEYEDFELVAKNGKLYWLCNNRITVDTVESIGAESGYSWCGTLASPEDEATVMDLIFVWLVDQSKEFEVSYVDGKLDYDYLNEQDDDVGCCSSGRTDELSEEDIIEQYREQPNKAHKLWNDDRVRMIWL